MIELRVTGMSCNHCVRSVTQAIQQLEPQARVEVNLAAGQVNVEGPSANTALIDRLIAAIAEAGYSATPIAHA